MNAACILYGLYGLDRVLTAPLYDSCSSSTALDPIHSIHGFPNAGAWNAFIVGRRSVNRPLELWMDADHDPIEVRNLGDNANPSPPPPHRTTPPSNNTHTPLKEKKTDQQPSSGHSTHL
jgi:hypothetical protein